MIYGHVSKLVGLGALVLGIIAVVLVNQPVPAVSLAGRAAHAGSIACALTVLVGSNPKGGLVFLLGFASLYILGVAAVRTPYDITLWVLFFGAGSIIRTSEHAESVERPIITLVIVSGVVMFLQTLGVGEWTQALTTHGIISSTEQLTKAPAATLFHSLEGLQANALQGRPAGLLHSNQFASLVVLFALALCMGRRGETSRWQTNAALGVTAVLTMSKVVLLGVAILVVYQAAFGGREGRRIAATVSMSTAIALACYSLLFPGLMQTYLLNWPLIWQSLAIRAADVGAALGISHGSMVSYLLNEDMNFGLYESGQVSKEQILAIAESTQGARVTGIARLTPSINWICALGASIFTVFSINRSAFGWFCRHFSQKHTSVFISLLAFSAAGDFLSVPVFWMMAGFALPGSVFIGAPHAGGQKS